MKLNFETLKRKKNNEKIKGETKENKEFIKELNVMTKKKEKCLSNQFHIFIII